MKGPSEGKFGEALRAVDLSMVVYKPPDDARLWKPCDFMVWLADIRVGLDGGAVPSWFEVKDVKAVDSFPVAEIRPSQMQGIRDAARVGIPYWLAVWWRRHSSWTVSDAVKLIKAYEGQSPTSIPRTLLMSRFGLESTQAQLTSNLKMVLLGEAD